jgi:hypothetical protein
MENFLLWFVGSLVGAFGGSFLGAYLKKKGENLATHEDFERVLAELKQSTQATKAIEAKFSDEIWDRQRQWELRRDAVYSVMQALGKADETLHYASIVGVELRKAGDKKTFGAVHTEAWNSFYAAIDDFDHKRALALIVCGKQMNDTLVRLKNSLRDLGRKLGDGEIDSYEDYKPNMREDMSLAFACARGELGITALRTSTLPTSQSSGSSATPNPD